MLISDAGGGSSISNSAPPACIAGDPKVKEAVKARHDLQAAGIELSPYYLATEIRAQYAGMMTAIAVAAWQAYDALTMSSWAMPCWTSPRMSIPIDCASILADRRNQRKKPSPAMQK